MIVEVKNGENLAALVKAFPNAEVRALITRPAMDCWRVTIPGQPPEPPKLDPDLEKAIVDAGVDCPGCGNPLDGIPCPICNEDGLLDPDPKGPEAVKDFLATNPATRDSVSGSATTGGKPRRKFDPLPKSQRGRKKKTETGRKTRKRARKKKKG
jgi:hypothetical protein